MADFQQAGLPALVNELWEMVLAYAKQQTLDPLRQLGKYVAFGVAGAVAFSIGLMTLILGGLRALQFELGGRPKIAVVGGQGHLSGHYTWVPYFGAAAFCAIVAWVAATRISKVASSEPK